MIKILMDDESSSGSISSEDNIWLDGCRYVFIVDKLKTNSTLNIKEHKLSSNNLDKELHDSHLLKTLQNPTNKNDKQTKSNKKLKRVHFSPIIFVKLVIPAGKKYRKSKTQRVNTYSTQELVSILSPKQKQTICN